MILNLSVPDEIYLAYGEFKQYHRPHMAMQESLKRFASVDPGDARTLVVTGKQRDELEKAAGGKAIDDFQQLLKVVKGAAVLKLDALEIPVPAEVLAFWLGNAEFQGREPAQYIREVVVDLLRRAAGK